MSSPTDITERLRKQGRWVTTKRVPLIPQMDEEEWRADPLCAEAADEIERLRDMVGEAVEALGQAMDALRPLAQDVDITPVLRAMEVLR